MDIKYLKHHVQRVLPLVYDDSLSYLEVLGKLTNKINETIDYVDNITIDQIKEIMDELIASGFYTEATKTIKFEITDLETDAQTGDVAHIQLNNNIYDIMDATAREFIETMPNSENSRVIMVEKNSNARFNTIADAVAYAKTLNPTTTNRVLILIGPGIYNNDIANIGSVNGIDLYGLGQVYVRSSVAWRDSTLVATGDIRAANIHFENYYTPSGSETAGYGLHADPVTGVQYYYNCEFYSDHNAGAGIGMGQNGSMYFYQCRFSSGNGAGFYAHNRAGNNITGQWIRCFNCYFEGQVNAEWKSCILIDDAASMNGYDNSQMALIFANCDGYPRQITYRYGSPVQIRHYISRQRSSGDSVWLWPSSYSPNMPGVDYNHSYMEMVVTSYTNYTGHTFFINNAYMYDWTVTGVKAGTEESVNCVLGASSVTAPDQVVVGVPGYTGAVSFRLIGIPKNNLV